MTECKSEEGTQKHRSRIKYGTTYILFSSNEVQVLSNPLQKYGFNTERRACALRNTKILNYLKYLFLRLFQKKLYLNNGIAYFIYRTRLINS